MGKEMQSINKKSMYIEQVPEAIEAGKINKNFDDDGRPNPKRTDVLKVRLQMQIVGQRGPLTGKVHLCIMVIICCFLEPIAGQPAQGAHGSSGGHSKIDPQTLVLIFVVVIIFAGPTLVFLCSKCLDCPCTRHQGILVDSVRVVTYPTDARVRSRDTECSICLGQFAEGDNVSVLPVCEHTFHLHCIRNLIARQDFEWSNLQCPNCRREYYTMRERQSPDFLP